MKMKQLLNRASIVLIATGVLLVSCMSVQSERVKSSPNFQEGSFKNVNNVAMHSLWEMFKRGMNNDVEQAVWPEWVESNTDINPLARVEGSDIRITFVNHATFLIQTAGLNILTDPVFSERTSPVSFIGPKRIHVPGIEMEQLPKIDVIIISHDHYDHLDLPSINHVIERDSPKVFVGLGVASRLEDSTNVIEMDWWEHAKVSKDFEVWFLDVQHFSGRTLTDRNSTLWGGFLIKAGGRKIYFGGDSGYADHYQRAYDHFGEIDIAFLPIGAYSPRELFKPIHMDPSQAVQAHIDLNAKLSIGMHYGTFQLSAEALHEPTELLSKALVQNDIPPDRFIVLETGKPLHVKGIKDLFATSMSAEAH